MMQYTLQANTIQSVLWLVAARLVISNKIYKYKIIGNGIYKENLCNISKAVITHVYKQIEEILKYNKPADLEDIVKEYNIQMKASEQNQKLIQLIQIRDRADQQHWVTMKDSFISMGKDQKVAFH